METIDIPVGDVIVRDRIRKDLGDLSSLMLSMEKVGQLQPIGILNGNVLVFGERRLEAAKIAGWETILAVRFDNLTDATRAMIAERDENTERKEFTPLEIRELAKRLEAATPKAKPGPKDEPEELREKFSRNYEEKPNRRQEKIAEAVGVSAPTLRKINAVAEAAEKPDAPPEVIEAAAEMDRTGKVDPAYQAVKAATDPKPAPVDPAAAALDAIKTSLRECVLKSRAIPGINHKAFADALHQAVKLLEDPPIVNPAPSPDAILTFPCAGIPPSWVLNRSQANEWAELYPAIDVVGECRKALGWIRANNKKTAKGMPRFLNRWLGKAQDEAGRARPAIAAGRDKLAGLREATRAGPSETTVSQGVELITDPSQQFHGEFDEPLPF